LLWRSCGIREYLVDTLGKQSFTIGLYCLSRTGDMIIGGGTIPPGNELRCGRDASTSLSMTNYTRNSTTVAPPPSFCGGLATDSSWGCCLEGLAQGLDVAWVTTVVLLIVRGYNVCALGRAQAVFTILRNRASGTLRPWLAIGFGLALMAATITTTTTASAQAPAYQEVVLYSFGNLPDGEYPGAALLRDKENLYGTTGAGGTFQGGTVFSLNSSGETDLYNFPGSSTANASPVGSLVMDAEGNLYGSTWEGGSAFAGTVFKVTPSGEETDLHAFTGENGDGYLSKAGIVIDESGNLYGTTIGGGTYGEGGPLKGYGTVYEIDSSGNESVLYSFTGQTDGAYPFASLILDAQGNLYGTTSQGGDLNCQPPYGCGTVFKLNPKTGKEKVLYSFTGSASDGNTPIGGVVRDTQGNIYGTTSYGGPNFYGNIFKLSPAGEITDLHNFTGANGDGEYPAANLAIDKAGNLYGSTQYGGSSSCNSGCGAIFTVTAAGTESTIFSFSGDSTGFSPSAVILDGRGDLYGTNGSGGAFGFGNVFELKLK
jgi:uncharacterized repeat protein (TIGR03803 family)